LLFDDLQPVTPICNTLHHADTISCLRSFLLKHDDINTNGDVDDDADAADAADGNADDDAVLDSAASVFFVSIPDAIEQQPAPKDFSCDEALSLAVQFRGPIKMQEAITDIGIAPLAIELGPFGVGVDSNTPSPRPHDSAITSM
jgi:hypothetical protein